MASPAADSPPALLVYDAELELISSRGSRWVPYNDFHTGYKQSVLQPNELIAYIRLPRNKQNWKQHYHKVGTRRAQAISKVCFAGAAKMENGQINDLRIAFGSIAPTPFRCPCNRIAAARCEAFAVAHSFRARSSRSRNSADRRHALHLPLPQRGRAKSACRISGKAVSVGSYAQRPHFRAAISNSTRSRLFEANASLSKPANVPPQFTSRMA